MHATDVVAYTFNAEILCPECTVNSLTRARGAYDRNPERALDALAVRDRIDRYDEHTFDSDDFPKVVFMSDLNGDETCNRCGEELMQ